MYTTQPKKLLIINILDILRKYTDREHTLSQHEIMEFLENEYGMKADRKTVKRNLINLMEFGYDLGYSESFRINKEGEEETILSNWYLNREFEDSELRLLIDSLLFSKHIPYSQCKQLIEKIEGLSNRYFRSKVKHVCNLPADMPENKELFLNIEVIDEAIEKNRQVEFSYCDYGTDKKLHPKLNSDGAPRRFLINPYQMVATNGRYYLIGNYEKYDNLSHYRVDKIKDIRFLETPAKPQRKIKGLEHGLNLPEHMAEHVYMFSGESERVTLRAQKFIVNDLVDWFGNGVTFSDETEETICAHIKVNTKAMHYWALQYAPYVTVLSPRSLAEEIKNDLKKSLEKYEDELYG